MSDNISYDYAEVDKTNKKNKGSPLKRKSQELRMNLYQELDKVVNSNKECQNCGEHSCEDSNSGIDDCCDGGEVNNTENTVPDDSAPDPTYGYSHLLGSQSPPLMSSQNKALKKEATFPPYNKNAGLLSKCFIPCLLLISILVILAIVALLVVFVLIADIQTGVDGVVISVPSSLGSTSPSENTPPLQMNISELNSSFQSFLLDMRNNFSLALISFNSINGMLESQINNLTSAKNNVSNIQNEAKTQVSDLKDKIMESLDGHDLNISTSLYKLLQTSSSNISNTRNSLESRLSELTSELVHDLQELIEFESCDAVNILPLPFPSGDYRIKRSNGTFQMYCEIFSCNGVMGGWRQIAYLNVSDPSSAQCPGNLEQIQFGCIRNDSQGGCSSVIYSSSNVTYSRVCGRINSFQVGSPDGFGDEGSDNLEGNYVDGISLTYGMNPRMHIWTLASRASDVPNCEVDCHGMNVPDFISSNYSCQSTSRCNSNDGCLVWDGNQCVGGEYFDRTLDQTTTDDVEMRVCRSSSRDDEDFRLTLVELYVQ